MKLIFSVYVRFANELRKDTIKTLCHCSPNALHQQANYQHLHFVVWEESEKFSSLLSQHLGRAAAAGNEKTT